jgi:hypothetical protein
MPVQHYCEALLQVGETCLNELTISVGCESDGLLIEPDCPDVLAELELLIPVTLIVWPT